MHLGWLWDSFGTTLSQFWDFFGTTLGQFCGNFWTIVLQLWYNYGIILGQILDNCQVHCAPDNILLLCTCTSALPCLRSACTTSPALSAGQGSPSWLPIKMIFALSLALCVDHLNIIPTERWLQQCTMCILSSTMALWSKAEIQKYTFWWEKNIFEAIFPMLF